MEQVGDIIERILIDIEDKKIDKGRNFSDAGHGRDLRPARAAGRQPAARPCRVFLHGDLKSAQELLAQKVLFRDLERAYADSHLAPPRRQHAREHRDVVAAPRPHLRPEAHQLAHLLDRLPDPRAGRRARADAAQGARAASPPPPPRPAPVSRSLFQGDLKRKFCKKCNTLLVPGLTSIVRLNSTTRTMAIKCFRCNNIKRYPYKKYGRNEPKLEELSKNLKSEKIVERPEWARFVKPGVSRERVPQNDEWWYIKSASILRKVYIKGPIGAERMSICTEAGTNRGSRTDEFFQGLKKDYSDSFNPA